jgi:hypothetical protein
MNQEQKLERFAEKELLRNINNLIIDDNQGGYIAFGKYQIEPVEKGFCVNTWDKTVHCFANKRSAISYCIADKVGNYNLARNIMVLDHKKQILEADIHCRKTKATRSRTQDFYETVNTKIQPKVDQYNSLSAELEKCINSAKYIQIRGFYNETARTIGAQAN